MFYGIVTITNMFENCALCNSAMIKIIQLGPKYKPRQNMERLKMKKSATLYQINSEDKINHVVNSRESFTASALNDSSDNVNIIIIHNHKDCLIKFDAFMSGFDQSS
jgi:hypothetical protein